MKWFSRQQPSLDELETLVAHAVAVAQSGDPEQIEPACAALAPYEAGDVIAELFLCFDDAVDGVDPEALLAATKCVLPPNPREVIAAAQNRDLAALVAACTRDTMEMVFATLVVLVGALQDARTRI